MKQFIEKIRNKENLTFDESKAAVELLMDGKAEDHEIFDFLTLLSAKGEVSDEIAGGVYVLRNKSKRVSVKNCIDTCGTGGDGMNTLNISTASALLLSSMGVKVAKHGNKAVSSKCGSGDVLEALNIKINLEPEDRNISLAFQDNSLFPHYTVEKNILLGSERNKEKKEKKISLDEIVELLDISKILSLSLIHI